MTKTVERSWKDCTFDELCQMERDNVDIDAFWIMCDAAQVSIDSLGENISIPRDIFNRMIDEYLKPRKMKESGRGE